MAGRETEVKKNTGGEAFPRERNGYSVFAVNEYIERMNRKFEDTLYDYKRQIVELKRDLEDRSAIAPAGIDNLLEQLGDIKTELEKAQAEIERLTAERDELQTRLAEISAEAEQLRAESELMHSSMTDDAARELFFSTPQDSFAQTDEPDSVDEHLIEILPYGSQSTSETEKSNTDGSTADEELCWPSLGDACYRKNPDDAQEKHDDKIYEIAPTAATTIIHFDAAGIDEHAGEIIAEARAQAEKILQDAEDEAERIRAVCLQKAGEEARAIKHEAYLRAKLMLDRIGRKLYVRFDGCFRDITEAGWIAHRDIMDSLIKMRVSLDDLSYTASDRAKQILDEFTAGIEGK